MIQMVVDNAHKHGKWAGICGELGADLELTEEFVRILHNKTRLLMRSRFSIIRLRGKIPFVSNIICK